ncbi:MAG TPA: protein kinase [Trebonia sp.]|nr:protein kinase [Trebonia sp.]
MRNDGTGGTAGPGGKRAGDSAWGGRRQSGRALRMGFVLDVAGYGRRAVPDRDAVQERLRRLVVTALADCGLALGEAAVDHQWTGDGINGVLPPDIDPPAVLSVLIRSLAAGLSADNARHTDRIRLRMAVAVGLVERSAAGFGGLVIVDINRLVDSRELRTALNDDPAADLAVAISDPAYILIVRPGYPGIPPGQFSQVNVEAKEFSGAAWIWLSSRQWTSPAYLPLEAAGLREIGGYRVVARLGAGQTGTVYLASGGASDLEPGWAALKVFDQRLAADPDARRRLPLGTLAARVVREPGIATVINADVRDDLAQPWVASTLVCGPSLAATVTETGPLPAGTVGWIALDLARALTALHETKLTHHAVTPRNVLLGSRGPVLTDFGVSRNALVTGPGTEADDILMLGATVFFAATGYSPWADAPLAPPPAGADPPDGPDLAGCPPRLAAIVASCLVAPPAARPPAAKVHAWLADEIGQRPRSWLPDPVVARIAEYQALPPLRGRFRRQR